MSRRAPDRRVVTACAGLVLWLLVWLGISAALLWSTLEPVRRESLQGLMSDWGQTAGILLVLMVLVFAASAFLAVNALARYFLVPAAQLAEQAGVLANTEISRSLVVRGGTENRALARVINQLVEQRGQLRQNLDQRVLEASERSELEKSRLAALMSELTQSVVVCNLDGRVLLYNQRARLQFRALSPTPAVTGGGELLGLGRSIYGVLDRQLIAHALDKVQQRLSRGASHPSAQFVTSTAAGQLLRVQMAPVRRHAIPEDDGPSAAGELAGFVLMLDNITREHASEAARDRLLQSLTEGSRSALSNIQLTTDLLAQPELDTPTRERFLALIRQEVHSLVQRIEAANRSAAAQVHHRWTFEDILASDLVSAAQRRIEATCSVSTAAAGVDPGLCLKVESFSLLQALESLAGRLVDEFQVRFVELRAGAAPETEDKVHLDLIWSGGTINTETVMSWELDPMRSQQDPGSLSIRDVVERHRGAFWFERDRTRHRAFFRFLLPRSEMQERGETLDFVRADARPEYYDFDLFRTTDQSRSMEERQLVDLIYTVFDTETTGLKPAEGDEIIQIGATRIVNGKLLWHECFEQLVDPRRPLSAASIPIHGITPDMLVGQPGIEAVLPAFHRFAHDTVLVAHNAAFDMRFLQLKERATRVVFDQPVLDTLLLSALVHPHQDSHRLEAIAERFNVPVIGRHTALGDALVTAEIFLKLLPLLADLGIHTLGQAREAAQRTYFARLRY